MSYVNGPDYESELAYQRERERAWRRSGMTVEQFEAAEARMYDPDDEDDR